MKEHEEDSHESRDDGILLLKTDSRVLTGYDCDVRQLRCPDWSRAQTDDYRRRNHCCPHGISICWDPQDVPDVADNRRPLMPNATDQ